MDRRDCPANDWILDSAKPASFLARCCFNMSTYCLGTEHFKQAFDDISSPQKIAVEFLCHQTRDTGQIVQFSATGQPCMQHGRQRREQGIEARMVQHEYAAYQRSPGSLANNFGMPRILSLSE